MGRVVYIPHKPYMRESAHSTKLRIVYDAPTRAHPEASSLNNFLNSGPPLQNRLWDVLVRMRFHPVVLTRDLKQAGWKECITLSLDSRWKSRSGKVAVHTSQGVIATRSGQGSRRNKGETIYRIELVCVRMATNLISEVERALQGFSVTVVQCWPYSTAALYWINDWEE